MDLTNPDVAVEVISRLYYGDMRASKLVKEVMEATGVSEPTVYSVLHELQDKGLVRKQVRSRKNVLYSLTAYGKKMLIDEKFTALDALLRGIKDDHRRRELMVELFIEDMLASLPPELVNEHNRELLRQSISQEIDAIKRRMILLMSMRP